MCHPDPKRSHEPTLKSGLAVTGAAIISLGCGASVGQYGPMVYLGTLVGSIATWLRLPVQNLRAISIGCGVAAAIATAFNAPIAGLVFAHEVILRHYAMQAFAPATVAAAIGYLFANTVFNRPPLFLVIFDGVQHGYEFALFAMEGMLCATLAIVFMRLLMATTGMAARLRCPAPLKTALAGLVLGWFALWLPDIMGTGQEALRFATIDNAYRIDELGLLIVAKLLATVMCLGFGFAGGVFSPSLLIGVLSGALFGTLLQSMSLFPTSPIVVYAICGMMAFASPVIGAPLTTIIIVFELTRSYDLTIAAMVAVVFSNLVAYRIFGRSLFDVQLAKRGFDLSTGRDAAVLYSVPVIQFMSDDFPRASLYEPASDVMQRLASVGRAECVVTDTNGLYQGVFRVQDALSCSADTELHTLTRQQAVTFDEHTTIAEAMERLRGFIGEIVPVVSSLDGRLLGVAPESSIIEAYLDRVGSLRRAENESV